MKLMRHKIELISLVLAAILFILRFAYRTISLKIFMLGILSQVLIIIVKNLYLFVRRSRTIDSLKHKARDVGDSIDTASAEWVRRMRQVTFSTNEFFDWLLPRVNVNVACAEHKPHERQLFRSGRKVTTLCFDHRYCGEYGDSIPACFFHLENLPENIEEELDAGFRKRKDEPVSIELRRNNRSYSQGKASLVGWNVFGLMLRCPNDIESPKPEQYEDVAFFVKTTTRTPTVVGMKVANSRQGVRQLKSLLLLIVGVELCIRLKIDASYTDKRTESALLFANFPHQFKHIIRGGANHKINEPLCRLHYAEDAIAKANVTHTLIYPVPPRDFTELVLSRSKSLDRLDHIRHLKKLEVLDFDNTGVADLSPIHDFHELKKLSFNFTNVRDLKPLRGLANLREIECEHTKVNSLEPLKNLKNLETLRFTNTPIDTLLPLEGLRCLRTLWCCGTRVDDLTPITGSNLTELNFSHTQVDRFLPITTLRRLHTLIFSVPATLESDKLKPILDRILEENKNVSIYFDGTEQLRENIPAASNSKIITIKASDNVPIKNLSALEAL